ncbi:hypothetical protein [Tardiphaga robiniae]|uniref:Uncharacterized protein n=1 Tax=Tardiphaga robiniae TaxID=943830 RepID=A0A161R207_9BRAD|nr:hypothetical protein [Tardiphaga robiniae]KZD22801.1 hypothetical protein A4A58_28085 [Tardiphaga robiniae]
MPPILGKESFHHTEWVDSQREFHLAYGQAMAQWALIEERLSYWFQDTTGLPYEMARAMFFSPRVFQARTDLLEAAIKHSFRLCECSLRFIKAATTKAGKYSSFRNHLAHGEQTFDARPEAPTFKQTILISGKLAPEKAAETAITVDRLKLATERYRELARLLMDATEFVNGGPSATHPEECLRLLNELPNQADLPRRAPTA